MSSIIKPYETVDLIGSSRDKKICFLLTELTLDYLIDMNVLKIIQNFAMGEYFLIRQQFQELVNRNIKEDNKELDEYRIIWDNNYNDDEKSDAKNNNKPQNKDENEVENEDESIEDEKKDEEEDEEKEWEIIDSIIQFYNCNHFDICHTWDLCNVIAEFLSFFTEKDVNFIFGDQLTLTMTDEKIGELFISKNGFMLDDIFVSNEDSIIVDVWKNYEQRKNQTDYVFDFALFAIGGQEGRGYRKALNIIYECLPFFNNYLSDKCQLMKDHNNQNVKFENIFIEEVNDGQIFVQINLNILFSSYSLPILFLLSSYTLLFFPYIPTKVGNRKLTFPSLSTDSSKYLTAITFPTILLGSL